MNLSVSLAELIHNVAFMKRYMDKGRAKPHKLIMLLSVLELVDQGFYEENKVMFDSDLVRKFEQNFILYSQPGDYCQPTIPFFHLKSADFWRHKVISGREERYSKIKKCGASFLWITDNIEYAFFSENASAVIRSPRHRYLLKEFVKSLLLEEANSMRKVGFSFHETLKMRRVNLSQVLECFNEGVVDQESLNRRTSLGTNEVKSAPGYLRSAGLIDWDKGITHFGRLVVGNDPAINNIATLWLMHYHFVAPHWYGSAYWGMLVREIFTSDVFDSNVLLKATEEFLINTEGRYISESTIKSSINVFLRAYLESDGFGNLNILKDPEVFDGDDKPVTQQYQLGSPKEIPWRAFAYILADFWEANWGLTLSVPFADLSNDAGPGSLLFLNSGQIGSLLRPMQEAGLVEVSRVARPWTVLRKWQSKEALLEAVYADDSAE